MKITIKREKYENKKVYYAFNLIDICFINTFQVVSLTITICNLLIQFLHIKKNIMNATINGTNYHSDLKFNQEKGEITIEVIQCRKVICQKITKMDLSLSQMEIEAFKLLYSNLIGTTSNSDELSLF